MKKVFTLITAFAFILMFPLMLLAQGETEAPLLTWKILIPILLGIYDVLARLIPTVNDYSWLSWVIKLLNFLNEFFNRKRR